MSCTVFSGSALNTYCIVEEKVEEPFGITFSFLLDIAVTGDRQKLHVLWWGERGETWGTNSLKIVTIWVLCAIYSMRCWHIVCLVRVSVC